MVLFYNRERARRRERERLVLKSSLVVFQEPFLKGWGEIRNDVIQGLHLDQKMGEFFHGQASDMHAKFR